MLRIGLVTTLRSHSVGLGISDPPSVGSGTLGSLCVGCGTFGVGSGTLGVVDCGTPVPDSDPLCVDSGIHDSLWPEPLWVSSHSPDSLCVDSDAPDPLLSNSGAFKTIDPLMVSG